MKKLLPILLFLVLLTGCSIKEYTPTIPLIFNQNAIVTQGDYSFQCQIISSETSTEVHILSTSAKGLVYTYNGKDLSFAYDNYNHSVDSTSFPKDNLAIIIYDVCDYLNSTEDVKVSRLENGYKYEGEIPYGSFVLVQNSDNSLKSLTFKNQSYIVEFE